MVQLSHLYMTTGKNIALTRQTFVCKVMSLLFIHCRFVIAFLPRRKCLFISWLPSPSTVSVEPKKIKSVTAYTFSLSVCLDVIGPDAMILVFRWVLSQLFHCSLSSSSRGSLYTLHFLPLVWHHLYFWGCWYFFCQSWSQLMIQPSILHDVLCI